MKGIKLVITVVFVLIQTALAFFPFWPALHILPELPTPREQLDWQIAIVSIQFTLATLYLGLLFVMEGLESQKLRNEVCDRLPALTRVTRLRDDDFYVEFLRAAKHARSHVLICYLAPYPPDEKGDEDRLDYYRKMLSVMAKNRGVRYKRIVRHSERNRQWIGALISDLKGCANTDIAVIKDKETEMMPLALSVQIVDGQKTWLVAVKAHERDEEFRNVSIENADVAATMEQYYDRLWDRSTKVLESGQVTPEGEKYF